MSKEVQAAAGQALMAGFHGVENPPETIANALREGRLGGVILFSRNIRPGEEGLLTLAALNEKIDRERTSGGPGPLIAVDQEGGRVRRVQDCVTPIPPMARVGATGDRELATKVGEVIANELTTLGFNLNFAPVLDIWSNPANQVIGDRAFGTCPEVVSTMAGAITVGHYLAGVVPCGKHFPGHGDTIADSHLELPILEHTIEALEKRELIPFRRAIQAGIPMLMTAHILMPDIDPEHPVTLSKRGLQGLLREELGFGGVVITDDLEMKAVADRYEVEEMIELGLAAGVDIFLICHTEDKWLRAYDHLVKLAEADGTLRRRLLQAADRVRSLKKRFIPKGPYTPPDQLLAHLANRRHMAVVDLV